MSTRTPAESASAPVRRAPRSRRSVIAALFLVTAVGGRRRRRRPRHHHRARGGWCLRRGGRRRRRDAPRERGHAGPSPLGVRPCEPREHPPHGCRRAVHGSHRVRRLDGGATHRAPGTDHPDRGGDPRWRNAAATSSDRPWLTSRSARPISRPRSSRSRRTSPTCATRSPPVRRPRSGPVPRCWPGKPSHESSPEPAVPPFRRCAIMVRTRLTGWWDVTRAESACVRREGNPWRP